MLKLRKFVCHALTHVYITCIKHIKMAKSEKFTMTYLGDKTFFHPEGFRKPNQPPVFLAAICLAEMAPGAGEKRDEECP